MKPFVPPEHTDQFPDTVPKKDRPESQGRRTSGKPSLRKPSRRGGRSTRR